VCKKIIIAHRGASAYAKENSLESFKKAIEGGADMVEFDVRKTKDNILIAHHGSTIRKQSVNKLTYEEIKRIDGDVPSVEEILRLTKGKMRLIVELKEEGYEERIAELLLQSFNEDEFIVASFKGKSLETMKNSYPNVRIGLLLSKYQPKNFIPTTFSKSFPVKWAIQAGADFLLLHWRLSTLELLERARENDKPVFVWTVKDEEMIRRFLSNNLIEGIITNKPDIAVSLQTKLLKGRAT